MFDVFLVPLSCPRMTRIWTGYDRKFNGGAGNEFF